MFICALIFSCHMSSCMLTGCDTFGNKGLSHIIHVFTIVFGDRLPRQSSFCVRSRTLGIVIKLNIFNLYTITDIYHVHCFGPN